ncbi:MULTISPECIES: winged helix-turn-helix domain-containing protein [Priestia]|uniref:winged helix-turn-helix domain-containing protein n=1 Tax=Priestia TaxID=2800373 RepID=UPI00077CC056|nr:transcriptional regulator [Priestia flexa]MED4588503.1 transcriptional regulator [Priestia flexa]
MSNVNNLNDLIHAKIRLGIMSLLMIYEECDFTYLKKSLSVTDGNLGSHLKKLEDAEYVVITKTFISKKPKTIVKITNLGADAYKEYISTIEAIFKK